MAAIGWRSMLTIIHRTIMFSRRLTFEAFKINQLAFTIRGWKLQITTAVKTHKYKAMLSC